MEGFRAALDCVSGFAGVRILNWQASDSLTSGPVCEIDDGRTTLPDAAVFDSPN